MRHCADMRVIDGGEIRRSRKSTAKSCHFGPKKPYGLLSEYQKTKVYVTDETDATRKTGFGENRKRRHMQ